MHPSPTPSQKQAIEHVGITFCDAGAGSGKTQTLISKVAHLIQHYGLDPRRILAITFTNRAAAELIERLLPVLNLPANRFPWVRTFHGACYRILATNCEALGFRKPLQIYSDYKQKKVMRMVIGQLGIDKKYIAPIRSKISLAKNSGRPDSFLQRQFIGNVSYTDVYALYTEKLKQANAADFDDILILARRLLIEQHVIREHYQQLFEYILLDESQDSNIVQFDIINLLINPSRPAFFSCGDDWQSLYAFRGASLDRYLAFQKNYTNCRVIRLEENFRSAQKIVQAGNCLIKNNKKRTEKNCYSRLAGGTLQGKEFLTEQHEGDWVAKTVAQINAMGTPYSQMVILYRTNAMSRALELAMHAEQIPYKLVGGVGFYERSEVMDLVAYLSACAYDQDTISYERALAVPKRGIGPKAIQKIMDLGHKAGLSTIRESIAHCLAENKLPAKQHETLSRFMALLEELRPLQPSQALELLIERLDYMHYLEQKYASTENPDTIDARRDNVTELVYAAKRYETTEAFLEDVDLNAEDRGEEPGDHERLSLMTIHKAKGTEFHAVFVIGCEEGSLPHKRTLELLPDRRALGVEEERRLMYVAITRAKRDLWLSWCYNRQGKDAEPSRFIGEISEFIQMIKD